MAAVPELVGSRGISRLTVRAVCGQAGLTERYFYESFADLDALVDEVFDALIEEAKQTLLAAVAAAPPDTHAKMRTGVSAAVSAMTDDPNRLRMFTEAVFDPRLTARRGEMVRTFAAILLGVGREHYGPEVILRMGARAQFVTMHFIGGVYETLIAWTTGELAMTREELIDLTTELLITMGDYLTDSANVKAPQPKRR